MKRGLVDLAKYEDLVEIRRENDDYTLRGTQGFCFIENDKVIKIYDNFNINKSDLSSYVNERIAFPYYYIEQNGDIHGEVMPYFKVPNLEDGLKNATSLTKLIDNYKEICSEICKFSYIYMYDLCYVNVLYDEKKGFYLIDTTSWVVDKENDYNQFNIQLLDRSLILTFYNQIFDLGYKEMELMDISSKYKKIKDISIGKEFLRLLEINLRALEYRFLELMEAYQELVTIYFNGDTDNIQDVKKYMKKLKNG